jgi:acid phosphatase type 7
MVSMRLASSVLLSLLPLVAFGCSSSSSSHGSSGDGGGDSGSTFQSYTPAGCSYSYAPPAKLGFEDLALDDEGPVDATKGAPQRLRLGLGGGVDKGKAGYADPTTSAAFTWETAEQDHAAKVKLGASATSLTQVQTGYVWTTPPSLGGAPTYMHEVHVCGLKPGTTYYYAVGGGPAGSEVWSATQSFTTVAATGTIMVGAFGDARDNVTVWQAVHERMRDAAVDLQLIGGDIVDSAAIESDYTTWLNAIWHDPNDASKFLTLGQQLIVPINGNHENDVADSFAAWSIPGVAGDPYAETYASFDVGNTHFVLLDDYALALSTGGSPNAEATAQLAWLDADLKAANADRTAHPFIVAISHRCLFSSSLHGTDPDVTYARGQLAPLYDKYSVDLVVNGHDHDYERSLPLHAGTPPSGAPVTGTGTTYVVSAGAGADAYSPGTAQKFTYKSVGYGSGTPYVGSYSILTLSGNTLQLTAYGLKASSTTVKDDDVIDTLMLSH